MKKCGNRIVLLDATYKTTNYSISLFFVAVKTNVKYMVVGSFAIQEEKQKPLRRLQVFLDRGISHGTQFALW